jgi:hypothetical protein
VSEIYEVARREVAAELVVTSRGRADAVGAQNQSVGHALVAQLAG